MGILKDKEVDKIILNTCDYADAIITVAAPGNPRAMSSCELAEVVRRVHENVTAGGQSGGGRGNGTPSGRERGCYHRFWLPVLSGGYHQNRGKEAAVRNQAAAGQERHAW